MTRRMMAKFVKVAVVLFLLPRLILAADYNIDRKQSERIGSYSILEFSGADVRVEVKFNDKSTLIRENILLNDPACPAKILSHAYRPDRPGDKNRFFCTSEYDCTYRALTSLHAENPIIAIDVRTALYDVFGQHATNLVHREIQDFDLGRSEIFGTWKADYNLVNEMMTSVTYVAHVRLADGTQWIYDIDKLVSALSTLYLEQKFGEEGEGKSTLGAIRRQ